MKFLAPVFFILSFPTLVFADQILVLSGGGTPLTNHYSQYLQTRTLFDDLSSRFPKSEPSVLFGGGNQPGAARTMADVHKSVKIDGLDYETLIFGEIKSNKAASPLNVEAYFAQEKLSRMKKDETFFLMVSDHGMPFIYPDGTSDTTFENNCIDLFGYSVDLAQGDVRMMEDRKRCLSKGALQSKLEKNVSAGRVVFAMSQCYSGGFHKMSVSQNDIYPKANPRICGFTSVTEDTTASGCTADVDGPNYQGYERSFTQQLTGVDIVTGERLRAPRVSLKDAHENATVEDLTKDIPLSTSDYYLWKWALVIGNKDFSPRTNAVNAKTAVAALLETKIGSGDLEDPLFIQKEKFFSEAQAAILKLHPELTEKIKGNLLDLDQAVNEMSEALEERQAKLAQINLNLSNSEALLVQQWSDAVKRGKTELSEEDKDIETQIFGNNSPEDGALFTMSVKAVTDPQRSEAISSYKARRLMLAMEWASKAKRKDLNFLISKIKNGNKRFEEANALYDRAEKAHGHLRRILIYRQALGAWAALDKMQDRQALEELKGLLACESTSF